MADEAKTTAWDGVPQNAERDGWHWLRHARTGRTYPLWWQAIRAAPPGLWHDDPFRGEDDGHLTEPGAMARHAIYLAPCPEPDA